MNGMIQALIPATDISARHLQGQFAQKSKLGASCYEDRSVMPEIRVEIVPRAGEDPGDLAGRFGPELFVNRVDEIGRSITEVARSLRSQLAARLERDGSAGPWSFDSIDLKFSINLEAEAGVIITKTKASAAFDVTLRWKATAAE